MTLLLLLLVAGTALCGYGAALVALFAALYLFGISAGANFSLAQYLALGSMILGVPLGAIICGALLDGFAFGRLVRPSFSALLISLAFVLAFQAEVALDYFDAALSMMHKVSPAQSLPLVLTVGSSALFCGGLSAFCLMLMVAAFELPAHWLLGATRSRSMISSAGLRPLLLVLLICLAFNSAAGLFAEELRPMTILAKLGD